MSLIDSNVATSRVVLRGNTLDRLATQALDYRDDATQRGLAYYAYSNVTIASGAKYWIRFVAPIDKYVVLLSRDVITDNTKLTFRAYTAYTGGTVGAVVPINTLRSDTPFPPTSTVNVITGAPTPTLSSEITNFPIYGSTGAGGRAAGNKDSVDTFRLFAPGSSFLIEMENGSSQAINVYVAYSWFELSNQVIL